MGAGEQQPHNLPARILVLLIVITSLLLSPQLVELQYLFRRLMMLVARLFSMQVEHVQSLEHSVLLPYSTYSLT